jgi:hypothetical protein
VFLDLRDDIIAEDYKKTLEDYLSKFIALAERNTAGGNLRGGDIQVHK